MQSTKSIIQIFSPSLDRQIDEITAGLSSCYNKALRSLHEDNIKVIVNYITILKTEANPSTNYRKDIIEALTKFAQYHTTSFKDTTRDDIISFLDSFRKTAKGWRLCRRRLPAWRK